MQATDLPTVLAPLSNLLAAFNHRHRNQHRRSAWWSHFNLLRHAVRRLLRASSGPKANTLKPAAVDGLARHAKWAAGHVVPSAYVAFTQLAADNQFAPLGLLLLGALARFNSAISPLLPAPDFPAVADRSREVHNESSLPESAPAMDLGESISRHDFSISAVAQSKVKEPVPRERESATPTPAESAESTAKTRDTDKVKKKKKKKKAAAGTDLSDIFGSLA